MTNLKLKIYGKVQGVFFRANAKEAADKIGGIKGYVKNLSDGTVEAVVSGEMEKIDRFLDWAKKGPIHSDVEKIEIERLGEEVENEGFEIRK